MPKIIPFFENASDNFHCLQACVKSALAFYFPDCRFDDREIDEKTLQIGGWAWVPPAVAWLSSLGLKVKFYSPLDYQRVANEGEDYMREIKGEERFLFEKNNGTYNNMPAIQSASQEMINNNLWSNEVLSVEDLRLELLDENTLVIGKTMYEWLNGDSGNANGTSHYVLLIKEYSPGVWRAHDPGLPGKADRKIPQLIGSLNIFPEVLLIKGMA